MTRDEYIKGVRAKYEDLKYTRHDIEDTILVNSAAKMAVMTRDHTSDVYKETSRQLVNINHTGRVHFDVNHKENAREA